MILIDKGRILSEKSVILIQDNQYKGFGYTDLNYQINNIEVLKNLISTSNGHKALNNIIIKYLKNKPVEKIIRF
jgi:DNA polymerase-3 subunit epsilon